MLERHPRQGAIAEIRGWSEPTPEVPLTPWRQVNSVLFHVFFFSSQVTDLNQINESHRARVQELEASNKELRRHVVVCEASDSAPSSSGISSIPSDVATKQSCDNLHEYQPYNVSELVIFTLPRN